MRSVALDPPLVPPAWYSDGTSLRWWDGTAWGPSAPPPPAPDDNQKAFAAVAHLGPFAGGFILPLILFVIQKDRQSLARHHAAEALNFQITVMVAQFASMILAFGALVIQLVTASDSARQSGEFVPWAFFAVFPLFFAVVAANFIFSLIGIVKATQNERWRYPICIRLVKP